MWTYLGQNFLIDSTIRHFLKEKTQQFYQEGNCESLIEIGPGKGALTKLIREISPHFMLVEKDIEMVTHHEGEDLIHADILEVDLDQELEKRHCSPEKTLVVGNLPYYITSPILRKCFGERKKKFAGGIFMIQKEVAEKIKFDAPKKWYLRRLLNYAYEVKSIKTVPPKAFKPAPKVTSAIISVCPSEKTSLPNFEKLIQFLNDFSPFTRKTLGAIATMLTKKQQGQRVIPAALKSKRLEECSWNDLQKII